MTTLLVLDFDGTMTDAEREGAPFRGAYLDDIATLAGLPRDEVESLAVGFEAEVAANAHEEGDRADEDRTNLRDRRLWPAF